MNLTQKETLLLEDLKSHEQLCIEKYNNYSNKAKDPELKQLFQNHAQTEQEHLNTLNSIMNGQVPNLENQQGNQNQSTQPSQNQSFGNSNTKYPEDKKLCEDLLMTEKYVSGTYDSSIFEFTDANTREVLNHIQKEEQIHGEDLFNYMNKKGMYTPQ